MHIQIQYLNSKNKYFAEFEFPVPLIFLCLILGLCHILHAYFNLNRLRSMFLCIFV